jgi:hypothetical protein
MPSADRLYGSSSSRILSSDWGGLSSRLIAVFYPLKRVEGGDGWTQSRDVRTLSADDSYQVDDGYEVHCPITDANFEMSFNWTSPFEGAGAESKAPTLSAMLQSGQLTKTVQAFIDTLGGADKASAQSALSTINESTGRTGMTKLNSTQTFTGMPPAKVTATLHFRAVKDALAEVRDPILMLEQWAVPQLLASESVLGNAARTQGSNGVVQTIYPSVVPQILGMRYGDQVLGPVVIESIGRPISNPRTVEGVMTSCSVQVSISTLAALDRRDIRAMYL